MYVYHGAKNILTWTIVISLAFNIGFLEATTLRLRGSSKSTEGRVEVLYNGSWGTVCDDGFTSTACMVVCEQLGFGGGTLMGTEYGPGTGPIWLDGVVCDGDEEMLNDCKHNHIGYTDCGHWEDVGCKCDSNNPQGGTCDPSRQQINPFDPAYPGLGRAEIQDSQGNWRSICDDHWDDLDAAVFCTCLGYTDTSHFRAYWTQKVNTLHPVPDILYDAVHCTTNDLLYPRNIDYCQTVPATGKCSNAEAAAVSCLPLPLKTPKAPPELTLTCNGELLTACFTTPDYQLNKDHLSVQPLCPKMNTVDTIDGVCLDIPMEECEPVTDLTDISHKHYCYTVLYTDTADSVNGLVIDSQWEHSACCSLVKNGTVTGSFMPLTQEEPPVFADAPIDFVLQCFLDDSFQGAALAYPVNISRGQELFCRVSANTWDENLQLVVPDCRFYADASGQPDFVFLDTKCPTTQSLGLSYYGADNHNWGFTFKTPKFQGYNELYLSCDSYVCDMNQDDKPYCDRSCLKSENGSRRRREAVQGLHVPRTQNDFVQVTKGPIFVKDSHYGPLITKTGELALQVESPVAHTLVISSASTSLATLTTIAGILALLFIL